MLRKSHFKYKGAQRLKVKGWEKIDHASCNYNKAILDILISDKADFRTKYISRDREDHI